MERQTKNTDDAQTPSANGCLLRLFWMLVGNAAVLLCALLIFQNSPGILSAVDVLYWVLVGCLVGARYLDVRYFEGTTADGKPASLVDWRRYALRVVIATGTGWLAIHTAGYFSIIA